MSEVRIAVAGAGLIGKRHVEDVLARHLERFGARRELVVTWTPD